MQPKATEESFKCGLRQLTWIVGHCRPSDIHGVERDEGSLEQTRVWLGFLQQKGQTCTKFISQNVTTTKCK